jgi:hypothetical protein
VCAGPGHSEPRVSGIRPPNRRCRPARLLPIALLRACLNASWRQGSPEVLLQLCTSGVPLDVDAQLEAATQVCAPMGAKQCQWSIEHVVADDALSLHAPRPPALIPSGSCIVRPALIGVPP